MIVDDLFLFCIVVVKYFIILHVYYNVFLFIVLHFHLHVDRHTVKELNSVLLILSSLKKVGQTFAQTLVKEKKFPKKSYKKIDFNRDYKFFLLFVIIT